MLFTTPTQFAALALLLFVGWLFGLASSGAGRKWHKRYGDEHAAYTAYRHETDIKLRDANRRIVELERANTTLGEQHAAARADVADLEARRAAPVVTPAPVTPVFAAPVVAANTATPTFAPDRPVVVEDAAVLPARKPWFAWDRTAR